MEQLIKIYRGGTTKPRTAFENAKADADAVATQGWFVQSMVVKDFTVVGALNRVQTQCLVTYHRNPPLPIKKTMSWEQMGLKTKAIQFSNKKQENRNPRDSYNAADLRKAFKS